jgi:hypothetical protein
VTRRAVVIPMVIFLLTCTVYRAAPVGYMLDSKFELVLSQNLLENGTFKLDSLIPGDDYSTMKVPNEIQVVRNHLFYWFPNGPALLSVPYVAAMKLAGVAPVMDGVWSGTREEWLQRGLAALVTAGLVALLYCSARLYLPETAATAVSLAFAFGTSFLSSSSRVLWSFTWGALFLVGAVWMLVKQERGKEQNPYLLATVVAWTYLCRPSNCLSVVLISGYLLVYHRQLFARYAAAGLCWGGLFLAYSWYNFGTLLPSYYTVGLGQGDPFYYALAGVLFSPSRGLLIFSPFLLVAFGMVCVFWRDIDDKRLCLLALAGFLVYLAVVSISPDWMGGHSYGPRLMTDSLPWLALLTILGMQGALRHWPKLSPTSRGAGMVLAVLLTAFSIFTHAQGAISGTAQDWNTTPQRLEKNPSRVWDWSDPQFLR